MLKVEVVDSRHLRILTPGGRAGDPEQVGDLMVIGAEYAPHGSTAHAVECSHNVNILACKGIPICIEATAGNGDTAPAGAHQNLTLTGNSIMECSMPAILVCSTRGLQIGENTLQLNDDRKSLPGLMRKAGMKELKPVVEIHCEP